MDVVTTSLEALIQRAMNPQNEKPDAAAVEAFCVMVNKEDNGIEIAIKLLSLWIQSNIEWQALQALTLLDMCMKRCGTAFNSEVGKFRFLNQMIKLVSPKYLGNVTPVSIKEKVLNLLQTWTTDYPHELKIKEALDMLKKQGVVKNDHRLNEFSIDDSSEYTTQNIKTRSPVFDDVERSKVLQKLLQSRNPIDLHAANRLIKAMVKEDEKRIQQNSRRLMEIEFIHNNIKLLSDMLDSYVPDQTDMRDIELMKELYEACENLQPAIEKLARETQDCEDMLIDILSANDDLEKVRNKYANIILLSKSQISLNKNAEKNETLLDCTSSNLSVCSKTSTNEEDSNTITNTQSNVDLLIDIFSSSTTSIGSDNLFDQPLSLSNVSIMQPTNLGASSEKDRKEKAFDDLNELGESLLKKNLSDTKIKEQFNKLSKNTSTSSLNDLTKLTDAFIKTNYVNNKLTETNSVSPISNTENIIDNDVLKNTCTMSNNKNLNTDFNKIHEVNNDTSKMNETREKIGDDKYKIEPLTNINISLETISPGSIPPLTVINEKNGVSVILHFAKDNPRFDVSVIVVTTTSKNNKPFKDYLFQAVVPKNCKCRLQAPSRMELPAHNPFLPPEAITQIMLIANPYKENIYLKVMLSYTMDGETITEMGEIDTLPIK